jgi:hypothetical protein
VHGGALRISDVAEQGDATRRASTRLVLQGLAAGDTQRVISQCERAISIDATNPYAYLVLASQEVQWGDSERGEQLLRQALVLLESEDARSPRVEPHLAGLFGRARLRNGAPARPVSAGGRSADGPELLERAGRMAPEVWADGWLTADELR